MPPHATYRKILANLLLPISSCPKKSCASPPVVDIHSTCHSWPRRPTRRILPTCKGATRGSQLHASVSIYFPIRTKRKVNAFLGSFRTYPDWLPSANLSRCRLHVAACLARYGRAVRCIFLVSPGLPFRNVALLVQGSLEAII